MNDATTKLGTELAPQQQREVLARYCHRMTHENIKQRPDFARYMTRNGYRMPIISDAEWLACTRFKVRNNGELDRRAKYCETRNPR